MPGLTSSSQNTSSSSNSTQTGSAGGTTASVSLPTFNGLNDLMGQLAGYSTNAMQNPTSQLAPIRNAGLDQINTAYNNVPNTVSAQLAGRGYGSSGLTGSALTNVALQKAGAQSNLEGGLAQDAIQQSQFGASLANQLLNTDKGVNTQGSYGGSTYGTANQNSNSTTTNTPSILSTITGLASLLLSGGSALGLFSGGGGSVGGVPAGYDVSSAAGSNPLSGINVPGVGIQP